MYREKTLGPTIIHCGLARILENMNRVTPGMCHHTTVVVNSCRRSPCARLLANVASGIPLIRSWSSNFQLTNCNLKYQGLISRFPWVDNLVFRDNINADIGAYADFYAQLLQENYKGHVLFMNSSVSGPYQDEWLRSYRDLFLSSSDTGLVGILLNSHDTHNHTGFRPHVQSYFLYTSMNVLKTVFPSGFPTSSLLSARSSLISLGEIGISQAILKRGYCIRSMAFPRFCYHEGDVWTIPEGDLRFNHDYAHLANRC